MFVKTKKREATVLVIDKPTARRVGGAKQYQRDLAKKFGRGHFIVRVSA